MTKVELKTGQYGWRYVHVDGRAEPWAEIHWDSHGPRGRVWYWRDPILRRSIMVLNGSEKPQRAEIRTQYPLFGRHDLFPGDPGTHRPTNERLLKVSEHLIAAGLIQNPSVTRAAVRKKEEARKRKIAQARERERKRIETRAAACLGPIDSTLIIPERIELRNKLIANIVAAMKWAQTR